MANISTFRARRRSAAERHALIPLQREIGSVDPISRRKYVQEFIDAFQSYERVISKETLMRFCAEADTLLVSDFHALDTCQFFLCELLEELAGRERPLVLLLEAIFARDQLVIDAWQRQEISDGELRQRLRFDIDWGYEWEPFLHTLKVARSLRIPIYGADCPPRGNMRRIAMRDRHAVEMVVNARAAHPEAILVLMFGESHLAPNHLPREITQRMVAERVRMVLQNVDALYFRSGGELHRRIDALLVNDHTAAVFNATPVEKWQSYRLCISRWREESGKTTDFTPALYDLIDALLAFLHIDRYAEEDNGSRYFVDCYPEVVSAGMIQSAGRMLTRRMLPDMRCREVLSRLVESGSCYIPEINVLLVHRMRMESAAQDVACFVHHACRDFAESCRRESAAGDGLYVCALEAALVHFGSRVLYPSHLGDEEGDLFSMYSVPREELEAVAPIPYREYMRMLDCVVLHRDYELHRRSYAAKPALLDRFLSGSEIAKQLVAMKLGQLLGGDLYHAYLAGRLSRYEARSLFFRRLKKGSAQEIYFSLVDRVRLRRSSLLAA
ncbi:MAG TPA: ChaN family lipoprotein [Terriglobales bacterium]|nr:ChaN family lipoprotein [Terriglobales bacterium]